MPHAEHARTAASLPRPEWLVAASLRQTTAASFLQIGWPPGPDPAAEAALVELTQLAAIEAASYFPPRNSKAARGALRSAMEPP